MTSRLTAITLALSLATGGCVTTTAHKLVLNDNPLREQAITCERECRWFGGHGHGCEQTPGHEGCTVDRGESQYAACLDTCPGAAAIDDGACPSPAEPGIICVETARANKGAIAGGALGVGGIAGTALL